MFTQTRTSGHLRRMQAKLAKKSEPTSSQWLVLLSFTGYFPGRQQPRSVRHAPLPAGSRNRQGSVEPELELQPSGPSLSSTMAKQTQRSMSLSGTQPRSTIRSLSHTNFFLLLCMLSTLSFLPLYHPHPVQSKNFLFPSLIFFLLEQVSLFPSLFNSFTYSFSYSPFLHTAFFHFT